MQAIRSNLKNLLCHGGRPHMGPRVRGDDNLSFSVTGYDVASPASSLEYSALTSV